MPTVYMSRNLLCLLAPAVAVVAFSSSVSVNGHAETHAHAEDEEEWRSTTDGVGGYGPIFRYKFMGVPQEMVGGFKTPSPDDLATGWARGATFKNSHATVDAKGNYGMSFVERETDTTRTSMGKSITYECVPGMPGHWVGTCTVSINGRMGDPAYLNMPSLAFCHYVVAHKTPAQKIRVQWWDSHSYCNFTYADMMNGLTIPVWAYEQVTEPFEFDDGRPSCGYADSPAVWPPGNLAGAAVDDH